MAKIANLLNTFIPVFALILSGVRAKVLTTIEHATQDGAAAATSNSYKCPGTGPNVAQHAQCKMAVTVQNSCQNVQEEILERLAGKNGWYDRHNKGTYKLLEKSQNFVAASRLTGDKQYTDKLNLVSPLFQYFFLNYCFGLSFI